MLLAGDWEAARFPAGRDLGVHPVQLQLLGGAGFCFRHMAAQSQLPWGLLASRPMFFPPHPCCSVSAAKPGRWLRPIWFIKG